MVHLVNRKFYMFYRSNFISVQNSFENKTVESFFSLLTLDQNKLF